MLDIDIDGSKTSTFGPKSGAVPEPVAPPHDGVVVQLGGQEPPPPLLPPLPLPLLLLPLLPPLPPLLLLPLLLPLEPPPPPLLLPPGAGAGKIHCWFLLPAPQLHDWASVPSAATPPVRSMHMSVPASRSALPPSVHAWFGLPGVQSQICSFVPFAATPLVMSRHLLP